MCPKSFLKVFWSCQRNHLEEENAKKLLNYGSKEVKQSERTEECTQDRWAQRAAASRADSTSTWQRSSTCIRIDAHPMHTLYILYSNHSHCRRVHSNPLHSARLRPAGTGTATAAVLRTARDQESPVFVHEELMDHLRGPMGTLWIRSSPWGRADFQGKRFGFVSFNGMEW